MFDIAFIPHNEITSEQLTEIINIKSNAWPYSFDKQLEWIDANLKETDIHVLLTLNDKNVAYLNLIEIKFKINESIQEGYGIGNVCTIEKGKGWGKEIMIKTNLYLMQSNKTGLLFCKNSLVNFYSLNNWILIEKQKMILLFNKESIETMYFNYDNEFRYLEYLGKSF